MIRIGLDVFDEGVEIAVGPDEMNEEHFVWLTGVAVDLKEFLDEPNDVLAELVVERAFDLVNGARSHGVFDEKNRSRHVESLKWFEVIEPSL